MTALFVSAHNNPRMRDVYSEYYSQWVGVAPDAAAGATKAPETSRTGRRRRMGSRRYRDRCQTASSSARSASDQEVGAVAPEDEPRAYRVDRMKGEVSVA